MTFFKCYRRQNFTPAVMEIISRANEFIVSYAEEGYVLTLRQLYYRFIAKDAFPSSWVDRVYNIREGLDPNTKNTLKNYKRLGDIVTNGREAGLISWTAFEDRNRTVYGTNPVENPKDLLNGIEHRLILDCWREQPTYVEVFVEKDALGPIVARPADKWRANHMACKGYLSASQAWKAGLRFKAAMGRGKRAILIHVGDHDPSGQDMTRDNHERLKLYSESGVEIERVALNMDQILERNPPPNPAKVTDSRFRKYVDEYGEDCWELDALEPHELDGLISDAIERYVDKPLWDKTLRREEKIRAEVKKFMRGVQTHWSAIDKLIKEENKK